MLELDGLTRTFGERTAVDHVTLAIPDGVMLGVIGRSGAGKSTLLRLISRLIDPTAGHIRYAGREVGALAGAALRDWRASCAMIFQQFNLVGRLDVLTNVLIGRLNHRPLLSSLLNRFTAEERAMALATLDRFDLAELALQRTDTLSGGQQQRVAICRALVQEPKILLADEPIASLDPRNARVVMEALRGINRTERMTVIVNLHTLDTARTYCERIVGLLDGRVVFDGTPAQLDPGRVRAIYGVDEHEIDDADARPGSAPPRARPCEVTPSRP